MITIILSAIKIIVLLGVLITIHEMGHFFVAKLSKVKVNQFAIGFGPIIWKKQGKETKYSLRLIPLGGFVSMEGEEGGAEEDEKSEEDKGNNPEDSNSFAKAKMYKRMLIVAAGSIVNIIFALLIYFILAFTSGTFISNDVDSLIDGYAAQSAGILPNDKIIQINGETVDNKKEIDEIISNLDGSEISVKVLRDNEEIEYKFNPTEEMLVSTGIYLDDSANILFTDEGSPAEKAGIFSNDELIKVNDIEINKDPYKAIELIGTDYDGEVKLTINRAGEQAEIIVIPDFIPVYYIGTVFGYAEDNLLNRSINGVMQTQEFILSIGDNLKQLFTGQVGINQMTGPVGISEIVAKTDGIREFFEMMALISISLGVTNLLPIPALDGGKIVILFIELIRRKPMKKETEINIQLIGFCLLIALSLYISFNDIIRIF